MNVGRVDLSGAEWSAAISDCAAYRYELRRIWDGVKPRMYVGCLNPSTADGLVNDHTVRKLIGFARRLELGGLVLWNLYALRSTDPGELDRDDLDVIGPDNDEWLARIFEEVAGDRGARLVVAWGNHGKWPRVNRVLDEMADYGILGRCECWGVTTAGHPIHPARLPYERPLVFYHPGRGRA